MKIGPYQFHQPLCLAPMEDVSDIPFRRICRTLGADIVYTEFTSCEGVIRDAKKAIQKITVTDEERPVAIQLYGGSEDNMEKAAARAEAMGPDFIDINCGCWVKNVVARDEGAGLLRDLPKFERIVKSVIRGTKLPVTVKTRLGWDSDSIVILDVAKMLEQNGVQALTVHCRTRTQGHAGDPDWSWLERIKKSVSIPIIGNGSVITPEDAKKIFETGCDGIMIGRAAIGQPWVFGQIKHYLATGELLPGPSLKERIDICLQHLKWTVEFKGETRGIYPFRKFFGGYFRGIANTSQLKTDLMTADTYERVEQTLLEFLNCYENV